MQLLIQLFSVIGGVATAVAAIGWLASKFFENRMTKHLEKFKARIKAETESEIESLKSNLHMAAKEREIALAWLHEKRARAIEELYVAMVDLQNAVRIVLDIFSPRNPGDIRSYTEAAYLKIQDVYGLFLKAKIFLDSATCQKIEKVLYSIEQPIVMYYGMQGNYDDHELHTLSDVKEHAWRSMRAELPQALEELESQFRRVLGVTRA